MVAMVEQVKDGGYNWLYKKTSVDSEYLWQDTSQYSLL